MINKYCSLVLLLYPTGARIRIGTCLMCAAAFGRPMGPPPPERRPPPGFERPPFAFDQFGRPMFSAPTGVPPPMWEPRYVVRGNHAIIYISIYE